MLEVEFERQKMQWYMHAWFTAILLSPHVKRGRIINPENLLPEIFRTKQLITKEETKKELEEIKKNLGINEGES